MKKRMLPFRMHPSSWGKDGKERELAEAKYYAENEEDLEARVTKVNSKYEKAEATEAGEPYVNVLRMGIDPDNVVQGYFELDWNDEFVKMLSEAGITGTSDEDVVNKWFNSVCRTVLLQEKRDLDYGMREQRDNSDVIRKRDIRDESED